MMINVVILWAIIANSDISYGTRDVSQRELEFLSHHLKDHQCRQLIEALHWPKFKLSRIPDGSHTPTSQSCIQMLEQWNAKESQGQSFVRLVERLRELQLDHLALKVSRAVFKDLENNVDLTVLNKKVQEENDKDDAILINNPHSRRSLKESHIKDFDGRDIPLSDSPWKLPDWTLAQKVLFVISSCVIIGIFGLWFIYCIPDCLRSLWGICKGKSKRNPEDAAQMLLNELDDSEL